jgi:hypothetical protein
MRESGAVAPHSKAACRPPAFRDKGQIRNDQFSIVSTTEIHTTTEKHPKNEMPPKKPPKKNYSLLRPWAAA